MANAQFDSMTAVKKIDLGKIQTAQTIRINAKEEVDRILSCGTNSFVYSHECLTGEVGISGRTNVKILYCDETGSQNSVNYNADFTDKFQSFEITPTSAVCFGVKTVDCKTEVNGNLIAVQLLLEISAVAYVENSAVTLTGGEDMYLRFTEVEKTSAVRIFPVDCEIVGELKASHSIGRVLIAESGVILENYTVNEGILTVNGNAVLTLTYLSDGNVVCDRIPFAFSEEAEVSDLSGNAFTVDCTVKNTKIRLDVMEEEINDAFTAEIVAALRVTSFTTEKTSVATDAYAEDADFAFTRSPLAAVLPCRSIVQRRKMTQTLPTGADGSFVGATDAVVVVEDVSAQSGQISVRGVVHFNALYMRETEWASLPLDLPFSETFDADVDGECVATAKGCVTSLHVGSGENVTVDCEAAFTFHVEKTARFQVISDAESTPYDNGDAGAIEVYFAKKGETLWDLAKSLHMSEDAITEINPDITSPLEKDTKIVIYNKL